jgi:hypothetical protein
MLTLFPSILTWNGRKKIPTCLQPLHNNLFIVNSTFAAYAINCILELL